MKKLKTIDLFAGAGGLSNGFEQTNAFEIKVAVEINENARATYAHNHRSSDVKLEDNICNVDFKKIREEFGGIDVVIGGPPCQGFSNANRQKNSFISSNNQLVKEFIRSLEDVQPKAFVMENVKTMRSEKHKFFCKEGEERELKKLGIDINIERMTIGRATPLSSSLKDFLMSNQQKEIENYILKEEMFSKLNTGLRKKNREALLQYFNKKANLQFFRRALNNWDKLHKVYWNMDYLRIWDETRELLKKLLLGDVDERIFDHFAWIVECQKILMKFNEIYEHNIEFIEIILTPKDFIIEVKTYNVFKYVVKKVESLGYVINSDNDFILNAAEYGVPQFRKRLFIIGIHKDYLADRAVHLPKKVCTVKYSTISDAIFDLEDIEPYINIDDDYILGPLTKNKLSENSLLQKYLNANQKEVYNHVRTNTQEVAMERFRQLSQGQNFHDLDETLKTTYSDHSRTQNTIYKRLNYNEPSGTVLNARKSMWIHPTKDRAITIREAARLQSFRDDFVFKGNKDAQYQQVGNAVPPLLARFVAESVLEAMGIAVEEKVKDIIGLK
ncbi:TPA: DNA cytosine methyltransferase [Bacillus cereus]|uniref:DNA cytosine methyltransferase n=1 Tax=Bacillus cereus TaxID=1396 RepID=UPI001927C0FD|nr:DNA cytosine methyltransferase [Bacillus cereus]MBL3889618.1 DNA cytosine methyltransferase [Bacillus cereus]HDX9508670.1 DNA cytosine methyltransferase [Bacillus cereus]